MIIALFSIGHIVVNVIMCTPYFGTINKYYTHCANDRQALHGRSWFQHNHPLSQILKQYVLKQTRGAQYFLVLAVT